MHSVFHVSIIKGKVNNTACYLRYQDIKIKQAAAVVLRDLSHLHQGSIFFISSAKKEKNGGVFPYVWILLSPFLCHI